MAYTKTNWVNDSTPAINADNLNKIEQGIYDNSIKIDVINNVSIAKMITDGHITVPIETEIKVTGIWISDFQAGDYICDISNDRIVVTNTEILETCGLVGGNGPAWNGIVVEDEDGNTLSTGNSHRVLNITNNYWSLPFPMTYYHLDKNKTYYVYLYCHAYNSEFVLNGGMGDAGSTITARKIK